jgi:CRP/FNR family cyclic AMP-dependent transcriptional regulator
MTIPDLTADEWHAIEGGSWFSRLSAPLRADILARARVRRLADGASLSSRGTPAEEWCGVARGAVRVSSVSLAGKLVTLTYAEPGTWFGDIALFDGLPRTHDADVHGQTTLLSVGQGRLQGPAGRPCRALRRLAAPELPPPAPDVRSLRGPQYTPAAGPAGPAQLLLLAKSYGVVQGDELRIGLQLAQEDLAQLLGASRQRVNQELKALEREGAVRVEPTRLVVRSRDKLLAAADR